MVKEKEAGLGLVYMTGDRKYVTKKEAKKIISMIRTVATENSDWIEFLLDEEWNISIIEKNAGTRNMSFDFLTVHDEKPSDVGARLLAGQKEFSNTLSLGGRLEAASCEIKTTKFKEIVEHITEEMNRITKGKFDYQWV